MVARSVCDSFDVRTPCPDPHTTPDFDRLPNSPARETSLILDVDLEPKPMSSSPRDANLRTVLAGGILSAFSSPCQLLEKYCW